MKSYYESREGSQPISDPSPSKPAGDEATPGQSAALENGNSFATEYHCNAEWHLSRLRSKYASLLHSFALHMSFNSERFYCSQVHLAAYFGCSRRAIWAAIHDLEGAGFFVRISSSPFHTNVYAVLDHPNWAEINAGKCTTIVRLKRPGQRKAQNSVGSCTR